MDRGRTALKRGRRLALAAAAALLLMLGLWHARPVLVWHITVAPDLRIAPRADRMSVPTLTDFPRLPPDWTRFAADGISVQAPVAGDRVPLCDPCAKTCAVELARGRLTLFDSSLPDRYDAALLQFAPSAGDISMFRSSARNWRTIHALAVRVGIPNELPETFRYRSARSQGIVFRFESLGHERFVIYAYSPEGREGRVLALSRTGAPVLHAILGGLEAGGTVPATRCSEAEGSDEGRDGRA